MSTKSTFKDKLWRYPGGSGWYFVSLPNDMSEHIKLISSGETVGLGYVRVKVLVGRTIWKTTLFPSKEGTYLLAVKATVRKAENFKVGDTIKVSFERLTTND